MPNKAAKTGTALEAPMVVELLPQAWPWIVVDGKVFISALAGMGKSHWLERYLNPREKKRREESSRRGRL